MLALSSLNPKPMPAIETQSLKERRPEPMKALFLFWSRELQAFLYYVYHVSWTERYLMPKSCKKGVSCTTNRFVNHTFSATSFSFGSFFSRISLNPSPKARKNDTAVRAARR